MTSTTITLQPGDTLTVVSPPAPTPQPPASKVTFGFASHPFWHSRWVADFDRMKAAGLGYLRMDVGWRHIEPTRGTFAATEITKLDQIVAAANARGFLLSICVIETPGWANNGAGMFAPPATMADYGSVVGRLAARYKGKVDAWEVWNEPNLAQFWTTGPNATQYGNMVRAAYPAIKAADPDADVIIGSLCFSAFPFWDALKAQNLPKDGIAYHPYSQGRGPDDRSVTDTLRNITEGVIARFPGVPLWITECGWSTQVQGAVPEPTRASYYSRLPAVIREYPEIRAVAAYTDDYEFGSGWPILGSGGSVMPSWASYSSAVKALP